jgi:hypothetical protein
MIGAEISASLRMLKDFKYASSNSKGTSGGVHESYWIKPT